MPAYEDLIDFDVIETQKENIQSLPGGRSARALAQIFSTGSNGDKHISPSPQQTRSLNDTIKQEYETELQAISESDDPLDIYDRYVRWTLNAYPSAQATPESGLLPLLERATKAFLSSTHYRNDPRYLRLWLHYIRLFSDAPRETFAFLSRHHVGEGLALFYEEFAAWLESAGRWSQAEEVYELGLQREARPVERLLRKFGEFKNRYEQQSQGNAGPSSPALPTVRPALAAKIDPFGSSMHLLVDAQAQRPQPNVGSNSNARSGKQKLAVFSDSDVSTSNQPPLSDQVKGWESIGSIRERKKENNQEPRPWAGETLKADKKPVVIQKMSVFRDESSENSRDNSRIQKKSPERHVRDAVNRRTGRRERVFVNLQAVYPNYDDPSCEMSFEELRAISRGWMEKDWSAQKRPLKKLSVNSHPCSENGKGQDTDKNLAAEIDKKLTLDGGYSHQTEIIPSQDENQDNKASIKAKKIKVLEIKGETQTIRANLDSPTGPRIRRKNSSEPTMTFHTRAATDEIYSIFNQPLKSEISHKDNGESICESDCDDDGYTSAGESTGTGRISASTSELGEDETSMLGKVYEYGDEEDYNNQTQVESTGVGEWTAFSASKHVPHIASTYLVNTGESCHETMNTQHQTNGSGGRCGNDIDSSSVPQPKKERFIPQMPDDYDPPSGPYRDATMMAQNRLPFMTPITEKTESSLVSTTAASRKISDLKTPCNPKQTDSQTPPGLPPVEDLLLSSPDRSFTPPQGVLHSSRTSKDTSPSPGKGQRPSPKKTCSSRNTFHKKCIIKDPQCNPMDRGIRRAILKSIDPPLPLYAGYYDYSGVRGDHAGEMQKYVKTHKKPSKSGGRASFAAPIFNFPSGDRSYTIKRELGAGAFAPVYLVESGDNDETYSSPGTDETVVNENNKRSFPSNCRFRPQCNTYRQASEAMKVETESPNAWEFYMIRTAHERLKGSPLLSRAAESVVRVHELHLFEDEAFLVEDYRGQGTLLDLINAVRMDTLTNSGNSETGMDEALTMFFAVELFRTVQALHACGILHGDIKPDNCLVRFDSRGDSVNSPVKASLIDFEDDEEALAESHGTHYSPRGLYGWRDKGLALIDFGRGIDMYAFPPSVQFIADWDTGKHECNEMREMRPWTYQIDLYGLAGIVHVMLFGKYIESVPVSCAENNMTISGGSLSAGNKRKQYRIREPLKRYWDREVWNDVFDLLLNPCADRWVQMEGQGGTPNGNNAGQATSTTSNPKTPLPVLNSMRYVREKMEAWLVANAEKRSLALQIRKLEVQLSRKHHNNSRKSGERK